MVRLRLVVICIHPFLQNFFVVAVDTCQGRLAHIAPWHTEPKGAPAVSRSALSLLQQGAVLLSSAPKPSTGHPHQRQRKHHSKYHVSEAATPLTSSWSFEGRAKVPRKNDTSVEEASRIAALANETLFEASKAILVAFDTFETSCAAVLRAAKEREVRAKVKLYLEAVGLSTAEAKQFVTAETSKQQAALATDLVAYVSLHDEATKYVATANDCVDAAAEDAQTKQDGTGEPSERRFDQNQSSYLRGVFDTVKDLFTHKLTLCDQARNSVATANTTVERVAAGLLEIQMGTSQLLRDWADATDASFDVLVASVSEGGTQTNADKLPSHIASIVSGSFKTAKASIRKSLAGVRHTCKSTESKKPVVGMEALAQSIDDLNLRATAACGVNAQPTSGPCNQDHRCLMAQQNGA